jgi:hypothetical protein
MGTGTVMKVSLDGGASVTLASSQNHPAGIAVDAASVYWINSGNGTNGTVMTATLDGGAITALATGQSDPKGIAVDDVSVYWTNTTGESDGNGTLLKMPLGGGPIATLASVPPNDPYGVVLGGSIALYGTNAYWTGGEDGQSVMKVARSGGTDVTLASGQFNPADIAVDATGVYWTNEGSWGNFPGGFPSPPPINGSVMKAPLDGGPATTLSCGEGEPFGIAVDATSIYWTNAVSGTVMKLPK